MKYTLRSLLWHCQNDPDLAEYEVKKTIEGLQQLDVSKEIVDYDFSKNRNPNYVAGFEEGVEWLRTKILGETPQEWLPHRKPIEFKVKKDVEK